MSSIKKKNYRPWGYYINLVEKKDYKVKQINIYPQQQPSYQYHNRRTEYWIIISGKGYSVIDGSKENISKGSFIKVNKRQKHHLINSSKKKELVFIEVMTGTYFGEDDIVRIHDKYDRV